MRAGNVGRIAVVLAASGASSSFATIVKYQVSHAGQNDWASSLSASPGDLLEVRVLVSYEGTAAHYGLGSLPMQPTVSHWVSGIEGDVLAPFVNGGMGSNTTTPVGGALDHMPGQYGRISPFAAFNNTSSSATIGHVDMVEGISYLRIARAYATSWIGGSGNSTGNGGVGIKQWAPQARAREYLPNTQPAAVLDSLNVLVFKFGFTVGLPSGRTMIVDTPADGFGNPDAMGVRRAHWHAYPDEDVGSIREAVSTVPASIHVLPAPGSLLVLGVLGLAVRRKRS